jgi:hypothetical protein
VKDTDENAANGRTERPVLLSGASTTHSAEISGALSASLTGHDVPWERSFKVMVKDPFDAETSALTESPGETGHAGRNCVLEVLNWYHA